MGEQGKLNWSPKRIGCVGALALIAVVTALGGFENDTAFDESRIDQDSEIDTRQASEDAARIDLAQRIDGEMQSCLRGSGLLADALANFAGGMQARADLYRMSSQVDFACGDASVDIGKMDPPDGLSSNDVEHAETALKECRSVMTWKSLAAERISEIADEGLSPRKMSETQQALDLSQKATFECAGAMVELERESEKSE